MVMSLIVLPARAEGELQGTASGTLNIKNNTEVITSLTVAKSSSVTLSADITTPALKYNDQDVTSPTTTYKWSSSDPNIVSVNENTGALTLTKGGDATITCTATLSGSTTVESGSATVQGTLSNSVPVRG